MTRTTRKMTGKTPWAAALTALLAVLALVFGAMAFAGVANAKDNGNGNDKTPPGHSETFVPPGQDDTVTPPGQDDNFIPPGQSDGAKKVWICHADVNNGNGNTNLGNNGTGGENKTGFNILYISTAAASNAHFKLHPNDKGPFATEAAAMAVCGPVTPPQYCPDGVTPLPANGICPTPPKTCPDGVTPLPANGICPTEQKFFCPIGTDKVTTPMTHAYNGADPADVAFCDITPEQAAAIDAALATVAPEPATVAPVEAATVPVPATAKPLPATIPAGDGSSVPTVPVYVLALLALGATALAGSAVRLAVRRNG